MSPYKNYLHKEPAMRMGCIALMLTAVIVASPTPGQAQYRGMRTPNHRVSVLLENGENLPLSLIASMLEPRLPEWPESLDISIQVLDEGLHLKDTPIVTLLVYIHNMDLEPTDTQLRQLGEVARRQLEAELNRLSEMAAKAQQQRLRSEIDRLVAQSQPRDEAAELVEKLANLRAASAGADDKLAEAISKQRELQLSNAGMQARREAIEQRIDEVIQQGSQSEAARVVLNELEKLVDARRKQLDVAHALRAAAKRGGSATDVAEAEAQLSSAIVELNRARLEATGGGELRSLNDELSKVLIEAAEIEGQRNELEKMIGDLRKEVSEATRAKAEQAILEDRIQVLRHRQGEIDADLNDLRQALARQAPHEVRLRPLAVAQEGPASVVDPEAPAPGEPTKEDAESDNGDATE